MAIVVMSPYLLDADVSNPDQLRRFNALCEFAEEVTQPSEADTPHSRLAA